MAFELLQFGSWNLSTKAGEVEVSKKAAAASLVESAKIQSKAAQAAEKAYVLGEGSMYDLIAARKAANENQLAADLMRLEALEAYYRIRLDLHQIWDFDWALNLLVINRWHSSQKYVQHLLLIQQNRTKKLAVFLFSEMADLGRKLAFDW